MSTPMLTAALQRVYGATSPSYALTPLTGDASSRRYYRLEATDVRPGSPAKLVVMQLPADAFASDEGGDTPASNRLPFIEVAELLAERNVPVPRIYAEDLEHGVLLLEDLGGTTFESRLLATPRPHWPGLYERAIDVLAAMHAACQTLPATSIAQRRRFDTDLLRWELEHFREWGLVAPHGALTSVQDKAVDHAFDAIVQQVSEQPEGFVHRDYQSRNLMWSEDRLVVIDFQDALRGPRVYDLVALLCDSYVALGSDLQEHLITTYAARRGLPSEDVKQEFAWTALHRKLKDAGRFVYIDRVRGNPDFLKWYPQSMVYVGRALRNLVPNHSDALGPLQDLLADRVPGFPDAVAEPRSLPPEST